MSMNESFRSRGDAIEVPPTPASVAHLFGQARTAKSTRRGNRRVVAAAANLSAAPGTKATAPTPREVFARHTMADAPAIPPVISVPPRQPKGAEAAKTITPKDVFGSPKRRILDGHDSKPAPSREDARAARRKAFVERMNKKYGAEVLDCEKPQVSTASSEAPKPVAPVRPAKRVRVELDEGKVIVPNAPVTVKRARDVPTPATYIRQVERARVAQEQMLEKANKPQSFSSQSGRFEVKTPVIQRDHDEFDYELLMGTHSEQRLPDGIGLGLALNRSRAALAQLATLDYELFGTDEDDHYIGGFTIFTPYVTKEERSLL